MLIGYARTSTLEQEAGLEAQRRELTALGVQRLFTEQTSSLGPRQALEEAISVAREGDTLVLTKLDRLARSVSHLGELVERLRSKGVALRILNLGIDTSTATGELVLNVMASIAQFERAMMLERQKEGVQKAKAEGKYKGRAPTARRQSDRIKQLKLQGMSTREIADQLGVSQRSVFRMLSTSPCAESV